MHLDDATAFILNFIRNPRDTIYPNYGYDVYVPNLTILYIAEMEQPHEHHTRIEGEPRARELFPIFSDAAWDLCRRGILRPGVNRIGGQDAGGGGYSITTFGREFAAGDTSDFVVGEPSRLAELFSSLAGNLGTGFMQRATEACLCHKFGGYLACCAMSGAAAESILLAVAITKANGNEQEVLALYRTAQGRKRVIERVAGNLRAAIADPFRSAVGLLSYWRDDAAHGTASTISEIEAHEALSRLLRFAQFANDNWNDLTAP
jgi:hypothetical protein